MEVTVFFRFDIQLSFKKKKILDRHKTISEDTECNPNWVSIKCF